MYKIRYQVVSIYCGNYNGCYGKYLEVESAIEREIELRKSKKQGECFIIEVIWEIDDNV